MYTITERMRLFYTKQGIAGKTAIDLQMESLKPIDTLIEMYECNDLLEEDLYLLAIDKVHFSIYKEMEKFYRKFYDALFKENLKDEIQELISYHDEVVKFLTDEIKRRKKQFRDYKQAYKKQSHADSTPLQSWSLNK